MSSIEVAGIAIGRGHPLVLIAGPSVVEEKAVMERTAGALGEMCGALGLPLIFKASYEKDHRSAANAHRGPGLQRGLEYLAHVKEQFDLPLLADVQRTGDVVLAAVVLDMLQIPASLCRQTSLLEAAAVSTRPINIRKGPLMSAAALAGSVDKIFRAGGPRSQVMLTERGSSFGHDQVISDVTAVPALQELGCPVALDAGQGASSGRSVAVLARAGAAAGADALFIDCHPDPSSARCSGDRVLDLDQVKELLPSVVEIAGVVRGG